MDSFCLQTTHFGVLRARYHPVALEENVIPRFGLNPAQGGQRFDEIASRLMPLGLRLTDDDAALPVASPTQSVRHIGRLHQTRVGAYGPKTVNRSVIGSCTSAISETKPSSNILRYNNSTH